MAPEFTVEELETLPISDLIASYEERLAAQKRRWENTYTAEELAPYRAGTGRHPADDPGLQRLQNAIANRQLTPQQREAADRARLRIALEIGDAP